MDNLDPFAECIELPHEVTFFVPGTSNVNSEDASLQRQILEWLEIELSEAYGGATENAPASGKWMSSEVGLVSEKVIPVTCYLPSLAHDVKINIMRLVQHIKSVMHQEAVLFVIDGQGRLA